MGCVTTWIRSACTAAAIAAVSVLAASSLQPARADAYAPGTSQDFFGVTANGLRSFVDEHQWGTLDRITAGMGQQGIPWARITFDQAMEEQQPGVFNWRVPDTMVGFLALHGVRGAGVFIGTAPWDSDPGLDGSCPWSRAYPYDVDGWAHWVAEAAERYGENGTFWALHPDLPRLPIRTWEIGNEVNWNGFWCPKADAAQYASVYGRSLDAITAVDPAAEVIVAGLAPFFGRNNELDLDVPEFLHGMLAADPSLRDRIPAVAIHPYASDVPGVLSFISRFRQAMDDAGMPDTPMLVNEVGWHTQGPDDTLLATEQQRSEMIADLANVLWRTDCGISGLAPHTWVTLEQNPGDAEHWYGLANASTGEPYPSAIAYGDQIRLATGQGGQPAPTGTLDVCHRAVATREGPAASTAVSPAATPADAGPLRVGKKKRKARKARKAAQRARKANRATRSR